MAAGTDSCDLAVICSICLEEYDDPKLLPCFHSFCRSCLEQHAGRTTVRGHFPCPQCRGNVKLPPKGVHGFQSNFYINNLKEKENTRVREEREKKNSSKSVKLCGFCQNIEARFDCRTCRKLLCNWCKKTHKKPKSNRNHHIVLIREEPVAEPVDNILCPKHKARGEILTYFCVQCDVPICMSCKLTAHEGHKSEDIDDRMREIRQSLREYGFDTQRMANSLEDMKASVVKAEARCLRKVDEVLEQIVNDRDRVLKTVTLRSKCLEDQLKGRAKKSLHKISAHLESIDENVTNLEDMKRQVDNCLEKGSYNDMVEMSKNLKEKIESMRKQMPKKLECDPNFSYDPYVFARSRMKVIDNLLGRINTDIAENDRKLMPKGTNILTTFTIPKSASKIRAIAASTKGIMICYDPSSTVVDTVTEQGSVNSGTNFDFEVTSIAENDPDFLIFSSASKKTIFMVEQSKSSSIADDLPIHPLAITKAGDSIIAIGSSKAVKGGIIRINIACSSTSWIFRDEGGVVFKKPAEVAYWSKGNHIMLIVTDPKAHRVVFFTKEGQSYHITRIYNGEGLHLDAKQFCPHGICVDKLGNIFVADPASQSVIQLSKKGNMMEDQTLLFEGDFVPKTLAATPQCHLVVGSTENKVMVIKRANP